MKNHEVAHLLRTMAALLEIKGEEGYKVRAYLRAADSIGSVSDHELEKMAAEGRLSDIPWVGKNLEPKIREIILTGRSAFLDRLIAEIPCGLLDLLKVPGIGPKTARMLYENLGIASLEELEQAVSAHRLQSLPGLGKKREELIARGLAEVRRYAGTALLGQVWPSARELVQAFLDAGIRCQLVGEVARYEEVIRSVDVLVEWDGHGPPVDCLIEAGILSQSERQRAEDQWDSQNRVLVLGTAFGIPLRVYSSPRATFGFAALRLTGPAAFLDFLEEVASEKGIHCPVNCSEDQLYAGMGAIEAADERDVFSSLSIPYVPPEIRGRGDCLDMLRSGVVPELVDLSHILGDLHVHTEWSDGTASIEDMVRKAAELGYRYIAITDHATDIKLIRGLDQEKLLAQLSEIREVSSRYPSIRVLAGVEVDIRKDGSLCLPDETLAKLDLVVASIHQEIGDVNEGAVDRLVKAARNPHVDIIGHPTGRLIGRRPGFGGDLEPLFREAARCNTALEINGSPERLDLSAQAAESAARWGVRFAVSSDAHSPDGLMAIRYAVHAVARRALLRREQILNSWPGPWSILRGEPQSQGACRRIEV